MVDECMPLGDLKKIGWRSVPKRDERYGSDIDQWLLFEGVGVVFAGKQYWSWQIVDLDETLLHWPTRLVRRRW